jgi:hypothetical protein
MSQPVGRRGADVHDPAVRPSACGCGRRSASRAGGRSRRRATSGTHSGIAARLGPRSKAAVASPVGTVMVQRPGAEATGAVDPSRCPSRRDLVPPVRVRAACASWDDPTGVVVASVVTWLATRSESRVPQLDARRHAPVASGCATSGATFREAGSSPSAASAYGARRRHGVACDQPRIVSRFCRAAGALQRNGVVDTRR